MRGNILAFVAGVWLQQQQAHLPETIWAWLPLLAAALGWAVAQRPKWAIARQLLFKLACLGAGFFWAALFAQARLADALPVAWENRDVRVVGVVAELPVRSERGIRFVFNVERVLTPEAPVPSHLQLSWYVPGFNPDPAAPAPASALPAVHAGERWQLTLRLRRPHGNANPHGFDYEAWLLERNIRATGTVRETADNRLASGLVYRPGYLIERLREKVGQRFDAILQDRPYAGELRALAIGDQSAVPQAHWEVFLRTGVNHLMSISGLHVTMMSGLVLSFVFWLWRRSARLTQLLPARKAAVAAAVAAALGYVLLAGFAIPAQRTLYMLAVVALALWTGRIGSASLVLSLALLAVVLLDPWAVLAPGFWLSFGAVAAMMYVSAGRLGRPSWLGQWLVVQWAVTLGLVPLLLLLFQQVSLVSPLANAFAIPLISLAVVPLTLLAALPGLDFLLLVAHELMAGCMVLLAYLDRLPLATWQQHAPPAWTVAAALAGIAWMLLPRGFPARWLGVAGLLPMFVLPPPAPAAGALWLDVLDVGQGLSVVARTQRHALLYDAGPRFGIEADSGNRIIVPFLRGEGIGRLDGMIISHGGSDHSGGAVSVLGSVPVGWFLSSLPPGHAILALAPNPAPCQAGQSWSWDGVRFDVLHPLAESYQDAAVKENDRGCVLKITTSHGSVLLTTDIEAGAEKALLQRAPQVLPAEVMVVPHHGSRTSSTEALIRQVHPAIAIFTVGYRNRFGHPKPDIVARYRENGIRLYRTDQSGALQLRFEGSAGPVVLAWRGQQRRYWQEGQGSS